MPALASTAGAGTLVVEPWRAHAGSKACKYTTRQGQAHLAPDLTFWMPAAQVRVPPHACCSCSEQGAVRCAHGESPAELSPTHYAAMRQAAQAELIRPRRFFVGSTAGVRLHRVNSTCCG
jgi:hypothetical protein